MSKKAVVFLLLTCAIGLTAMRVEAVEDPVYGYQLMTRQERIDYRDKMHSLKTEEERAAFRLEHHKLMQERARAKGITLPDEPMPGHMGQKRQGMGPGNGMAGPGHPMGQGSGMGHGSGMAPGSGMGPGSGMQGSGMGQGSSTGQGDTEQPAKP